MTTQTYAITGMTCGHCVGAVTSELEALPGVTAVEVDLDSASARVTSDAPLELDAVRAAVDEAGYTLAAGS